MILLEGNASKIYHVGHCSPCPSQVRVWMGLMLTFPYMFDVALCAVTVKSAALSLSGVGPSICPLFFLILLYLYYYHCYYYYLFLLFQIF